MTTEDFYAESLRRRLPRLYPVGVEAGLVGVMDSFEVNKAKYSTGVAFSTLSSISYAFAFTPSYLYHNLSLAYIDSGQTTLGVHLAEMALGLGSIPFGYESGPGFA
jgi:hypothetical protein